MIHFQNLSASVHRLGDALAISSALTTHAAHALLVVLSAGLALLPLFQNRTKSTTAFGASEFACLLAWIPLLSPVTWHHLGIFYLPLLYATALTAFSNPPTVLMNLPKLRWFQEPKTARLQLAAFFIFYTLTGRNVLGTNLHAWVSHHSIPMIGILALVLPATLRLLTPSHARSSAV